MRGRGGISIGTMDDPSSWASRVVMEGTEDDWAPVSLRGGRREGFGGRPGRSERVHGVSSDIVSLKRSSDSDNEDVCVDDFERELKKTYRDLVRLEPVRRALYVNKDLDIMFIIDCTGSMGSWIDACKKEIKSIIDCVRN
jgi:hypothetical protein